MKNFIEAENLFIKNRGNRYYMALNGELDKYNSFKVPKNYEKIWINKTLLLLENEYVFSNDTKLKIYKFVDYLTYLKEINAKKFNKNYYKLIKEFDFYFDDFTQLYLIENILKLINDKGGKKIYNLKQDYLIKLIKMYQCMYIKIDTYKENGILPDYLLENNLKYRIKNDIKMYF